MNLKELYDSNVDFKRFVDRSVQQYGFSLEETLEHAIIKEYAIWLLEG